MHNCILIILNGRGRMSLLQSGHATERFILSLEPYATLLIWGRYTIGCLIREVVVRIK